MYTQCPECETTFKLGADDLRQANGRVRCGDCDTVFNALEYLAEEVGEAAGSASMAADGWTSSAANPSGDVEPDLDEYEQAAELDADDAVVEHFDDEAEDDDGAILYIDDSDDADDELPATDEEAVAGEADDTEPEADEDEIDDSVWDNIPGVGADLHRDPGDHEHDGHEDSDAGHDEERDENREEEADENRDDEARDSGDDLEFNVPEDKWTNFFGPLPKGQVASVWQPPALNEDDLDSVADDEAEELDEVGEDAAGDGPEADTDAALAPAPQWPAAEAESRSKKLLPVAVIVAVLALVSQLIHYNRDGLAASPTYGPQIRAVYATLGSELYPEWDINGFEIRGSEAIAGESGADIMDIRAQIANIGDHAAGLPRLRVVLRDRWSNPVAARDFGADEYATDAVPADLLLQPGAVASAHVSIQDPGAGAQGFELELCLPRRHSGLECTGQPFK